MSNREQPYDWSLPCSSLARQHRIGRGACRGMAPNGSPCEPRLWVRVRVRARKDDTDSPRSVSVDGERNGYRGSGENGGSGGWDGYKVAISSGWFPDEWYDYNQPWNRVSARGVRTP